MSEITLFSTANEGTPARRLQPGKVGLEKNLQSLCEHNMEEFFGEKNSRSRLNRLNRNTNS